METSQYFTVVTTLYPAAPKLFSLYADWSRLSLQWPCDVLQTRTYVIMSIPIHIVHIIYWKHTHIKACIIHEHTYTYVHKSNHNDYIINTYDNIKFILQDNASVRGKLALGCRYNILECHRFNADKIAHFSRSWYFNTYQIMWCNKGHMIALIFDFVN